MPCPRCRSDAPCGAGWLSPAGGFLLCKCDRHDWAMQIMGCEVGTAELAGWVRVYARDETHFVEPHAHWLSVVAPTQRQLDWLADHGYAV